MSHRRLFNLHNICHEITVACPQIHWHVEFFQCKINCFPLLKEPVKHVFGASPPSGVLLEPVCALAHSVSSAAFNIFVAFDECLKWPPVLLQTVARFVTLRHCEYAIGHPSFITSCNIWARHGIPIKSLLCHGCYNILPIVSDHNVQLIR